MAKFSGPYFLTSMVVLQAKREMLLIRTMSISPLRAAFATDAQRFAFSYRKGSLPTMPISNENRSPFQVTCFV